VLLAAACLLLPRSSPAGEPSAAPTGCQIGAEIPYFYVREVTTERPNLATCLVCRYGSRPVVMMCVRQLDPQVERVLTAVDRAVDGARGRGLRGFAVFLTDDPAAAQPQMMRLARQGKFSVPLTLPVENGGPRSLAVPDDARLTVLCYSDKKIVARHVFGADDIGETQIVQVLADLKRLAE
jgi:hypothetical protein